LSKQLTLALNIQKKLTEGLLIGLLSNAIRPHLQYKFTRSIFLLGFKWEYPGCSNDEISPLYQSILNIEEQLIPFGDQAEFGCTELSSVTPRDYTSPS